MSSSKQPELTFRFGPFGKFIPIIIALVFVFIAAANQSNVSGYVIAFFMAVIFGVLFAKDEKAYGQAIINGIARPIFGVISITVILATISGSLISKSGLIQTVADFVVSVGFTGGLFAAVAFLLACVISFSTGTSVGTNLIMVPILFPIGVMAGVSPAFMVGALVSGAAFGDNLAPVSDTTIASAGSQGADMTGVVKTRAKYSLPVAGLTFIALVIFGGGGEKVAGFELEAMETDPKSLLMLLVPVTVIVLCLLGKHLITALSAGVAVGLVVGVVSGLYAFDGIVAFPGGFKVEGLFIESITSAMSTVAMLFGVFAMLGVMQASGVVESVGQGITKLARGVRGTEATIVGSIAILGMITGVIAVGIVAIGDIISDMGEKAGIDKYRRANLMDCAGIGFCFLAPWTVHTVLPAQLTSQFGEAFAVAPTGVATHNIYSMLMVALLVVSIITGYGRKSKLAQDPVQAKPAVDAE